MAPVEESSHERKLDARGGRRRRRAADPRGRRHLPGQSQLRRRGRATGRDPESEPDKNSSSSAIDIVGTDQRRSTSTSWVPFSSDRFGYDMAVPASLTATPATRDRTLDADKTNDQLRAPTSSSRKAWRTRSPYKHFRRLYRRACRTRTGSRRLPRRTKAALRSQSTNGKRSPSTGMPAMFNPDACDASQAFVFIGDPSIREAPLLGQRRVYRFSTWRGDQPPLLKAFLSTVRFHSDAPPSHHRQPALSLGSRDRHTIVQPSVSPAESASAWVCVMTLNLLRLGPAVRV